MSIRLDSPEFDPTDPRIGPARDLYEHLGLAKALVAVNYGHPCLDCGAIGDKAFYGMAANVPPDPEQAKSKLFKRAFALAEEALRNPGPPKYQSTDALFGLLFDEKTRAVFRAIDNLPPEMRKVYQASSVFGLSDETIAAIFDIEPETVRGQRAKAIKRLVAQSVDISRLKLIHGITDSIVEPTGDTSVPKPRRDPGES